MRSKILVVLSAVAIMGVSSTAMARGGMHGGMHGGMFMHGHGHFDHHFRFVNRFNRNLFNRFNGNLGGWGWGGEWGGGGYGDNGSSNTTVVIVPQARPVVFPQAKPQAADVTGSIAADPCHFTADTYNVPSSAGGTRPVQVVSCR